MTLNTSIAHASVNTWKSRVGLNLSPWQDRNVPGSSTSRVRARRWSALALAGSGKPRRNGETPGHISNSNAQVIDPLDPCDELHPFVTSSSPDLQDAFSSAGSCDLPSPGLAFDLRMGFVVLAQQGNVPDIDLGTHWPSETESTSQFKSKNRSVFSDAPLYHHDGQENHGFNKCSLMRSTLAHLSTPFRRFHEAENCTYTIRRALRRTVSLKKEKSYDQTTTVSCRGDLRANAVG